MNFGIRFARQSRSVLLTEALALIAITGVLDYVTGWEYNLFLLYTVPILMMAWFADAVSAVIVATLAGFTWWLANLNVNPYETRFGFLWATITQIIYFEFVAIGGSAIRAHQSADRARIDALETEHRLEQEIVQVSEREQERIGQDLHDGVCQQLAAIGCAATLLKKDLQSHQLPQSEGAREIEQLISDAVKEVRSLARGIFPVQMDESGLSAALQELVSSVTRLTPVKASLTVEGNTNLGDPRVAMHLYRIAQEALNNALRHSHATEVSISLSSAGNELRMEISDNGQGFAEPRPTPRGMGLKTMEYRARLIGGKIHFQNCPAGGVLITLAIPRDGKVQ